MDLREELERWKEVILERTRRGRFFLGATTWVGWWCGKAEEVTQRIHRTGSINRHSVATEMGVWAHHKRLPDSLWQML